VKDSRVGRKTLNNQSVAPLPGGENRTSFGCHVKGSLLLKGLNLQRDSQLDEFCGDFSILRECIVGNPR
jgi:hypothetical protein